MTWPASDVSTTNTDSGLDAPSTARSDFLDLIQKFNQLRSHVSAFMQGLLDDADAATARSTLGLGTAATQADTKYAHRANNLNDLTNAATARANIGAFAAAHLPAGTKMLFQQTAAPTGWTKDTTHNDKALRVVSGTAGSGGTDAFTTVFGAGKTSGGHTLTQAETPLKSHNHTGSGSGTAASAGEHAHDVSIAGGVGAGPAISDEANNPAGSLAGAALSAGAHEHPVSVTLSINNASDATASAHTHPLTMNLQFVDIIIATKD